MLQTDLFSLLPYPISLPVDDDMPELRPTTSSTAADLDPYMSMLAMPSTPGKDLVPLDDVHDHVHAYDDVLRIAGSPDHFLANSWTTFPTLDSDGVADHTHSTHGLDNHKHPSLEHAHTHALGPERQADPLPPPVAQHPSLPLALPQTMPGAVSTNSSPVDFAFEAPTADKAPILPSASGPASASAAYAGQAHYTPNNQYPPPYNSGYSGSSFSSSASGSISGASFSSIDALPVISREFVRPSPVTTRRPVTAGGALQSRSPLANTFASQPHAHTHAQAHAHPQHRKDTIDEEMFTNPFSNGDTRPQQADGVDPRFIPQSRRASEGHFNMPPPSWPPQQQPEVTVNQAQYSYYNNAYRAQQASNARPQTSDGLPSFGGPQALPSARSVVGSVDGFTPLSGLAPAAHIRSSYDEAMYRDRPSSSSALDPRYGAHPSSDSELTFVTLGGPVPKKRPRRRYDEIERLYLCGWNGCEKSYGTLNHLNAHVAMQKHGEKRLPQEFKDMRKAWRKRKREQAAAVAAAGGVQNGQYGSWGRSSMSSESDYERRDSTLSGFSSGSRYPADGSSMYSYDSRPNTASSVGSSVDARPFAAPSNIPPYAYAPGGAQAQGYQPNPHVLPHPHSHAHANANAVRRDSAPHHIPIPQGQAQMGFRAGEDGPTPTQMNPFPVAGNSAVPVLRQPQGLVQGQGQQGQGGFPFQALTQPMPMAGGSGYSQFAFQR